MCTSRKEKEEEEEKKGKLAKRYINTYASHRIKKEKKNSRRTTEMPMLRIALKRHKCEMQKKIK
jgi:hypothetical protein